MASFEAVAAQLGPSGETWGPSAPTWAAAAGALKGAGPALANHLWQSTVFALAAGLLALALRRNHARARYWIWMAASLKFVLPFALLASIGSHLARPRALAAPAEQTMYFAVEDFSEPFATPLAPIAAPVAPSPWRAEVVVPLAVATVWLAGCMAVLGLWCVRWRRVARAMRKAVPMREGREVAALRRIEQVTGLRARIALRLSDAAMEPGVFGFGFGFGIARPVLAWPAGISARLDDAQLDAVLAHEVCHVRRRDNLTAALHMLVESAFWFHPLVWWLGARLLAERERACDEEVLLRCAQPQAYAESILKVCEFCVESPLQCVSGVTGADLKQRVVEIMTGSVARRLTLAKKLLLGAAALCAVAVPVLLGQAQAARRMMLAAVAAAPKPVRAMDGAVSFAARVASPIELESTTPHTLIALPPVREFQLKQPVNLAQAEAPAAPDAPHLSALRQINVSAQAAGGPAQDFNPILGMIASPRPIYPPEAKAAGIQGTVEVSATITSSGTVEDPHVISGPQELRQSTIDAVKQWRFKPFLDNFKPVEWDIRVGYQLPALVPAVGPVPPPDEAATGVKQYGGDITVPMMIYRVEPAYTELAKTDRVEGAVTVSLVVDQHGVPQHVQVVRALGDGLDEKVIEAVKQDRFKPARENDKPVPVFMYLPVNFKLN